MDHPENQYLGLLSECLTHGEALPDRTGTGVKSLFGRQLRFDLAQGFPLLTTKKVHVASVYLELMWMLKGRTDVRWLQQNGVTIWDEWADSDGELGPVYGEQWRRWRTVGGFAIDQIAKVQQSLRDDPFSRRHIVSAWNPADLDDMALPPCHALFQFRVGTGGRLSCQVYQRSADVFLGLPFNIASYALMTHMMATVTRLTPGDLVFSLGDVHLYMNHQDQARTQLARVPRPWPTLLPVATPPDNVWEFGASHYALQGYDPWPAIPAPVAI